MHRRELLTTFATAGATAAATMASGEPTLAADDNAAVHKSTARRLSKAMTAQIFIGRNGDAASRFCSCTRGA